MSVYAGKCRHFPENSSIEIMIRFESETLGAPILFVSVFFQSEPGTSTFLLRVCSHIHICFRLYRHAGDIKHGKCVGSSDF